MNTCKSCGAKIIWAVTLAGKRMPVDAQSSERGNVELYDEGDHIRALIVNDATLFDDLAARPRHLPHFVTCPDADQHRKRTK